MAKNKDRPATDAAACWLFQSNYQVFDLKAALRAEALRSFPVRAHAGRIKAGDKAIIWQTGRAQACYALIVVRSAPASMEVPAEERPFHRETPAVEDRVLIEVEYNLWDRPLTKDMLPSGKTFETFHAGLSGTNYRATRQQYQSLVALVAQQDTLYEPEAEYFIHPGFYPPLNLILYGPPGTGKTYRTINHAVAIIENRPLEEIDLEDRRMLKGRFDHYQAEGRIAFVTFHQSFAYEDFMEGIKPVLEEGQVVYRVEPGIFMRICRQAMAAAAAHTGAWSGVPRYVLIMDEINRGNVSAIFGELISLIEPDKRQGCAEALQAVLPYSKLPLGVPANLYLLGTMNTADRSTESLDLALRRRFAFQEVPSDPHLISQLARQPMVAGVDLEKLLAAINDRLEALLDEQARIGHAFFLQIRDLDDLRAVFDLHILPLLKDFFFHDLSRIGLVLGRAFLVEERQATGKFADFEHPYAEELLQQHHFRLRPVQELEERDFIRVYHPGYDPELS